MIQKTLTVYCDECALQESLMAQTLKEAASELANKHWQTDNKHHYCPNCSEIKRQAALQDM